MSTRYQKFEEQALEQIKDCKGSDLRFFRIEEYLRNAERIDLLAEECPSCANIRKQMEAEVGNLKEAVEQPGKSRKKLDEIQDQLVNHLRKSHGYYPPMYHTYMQSIYWLMGFMLAAFIIVKLFATFNPIAIYSPAFVIGVVIGQVRGSKKDREIQKTGKQL
ncbi:MAG: hypothetical protein ACK5LR_04180 [Mangrovibacterium sp.]